MAISVPSETDGAAARASVSTATRVRRGAPLDLRRALLQMLGLAIVVAVLAYIPEVFEGRSLFGIGLSGTATLGIGLADINFMLLSVMSAVALNLLVGYTGLLSLGHSAFLAIGAAAGGLLGVQAGLPFWLVAICAFTMGAAIGVLAGLPSMRVGGLYLLLSTFALNALVVYGFLRYQTEAFGVAGIIYPIPSLAGWHIETDRDWYILLLVCVIAILLISRNLLKSREGRAFVAVRDHDVAAASCGVNVSMTKLRSFAFTSGMVSFAGVLYAYYLASANADTYTLELTIGFYAMIIIGGMGSLLGAVLGAMLWSFLPAILTTLSQEVPSSTPVVGSLLADHRDQLNLLIFGLLIIIILILMPRGLAGVWQSARAALRNWPYRA